MPTTKSVKAPILPPAPPKDADQKKDKLSFRVGPQLSIKADLALVVHGKLTPTGEPATLICTNYHIHGETPKLQFTKIFSQFNFYSNNPTDSTSVGPEVISIYPTENHANITNTAKTVDYRLPIRLPTEIFQVSAGIELSYEKETTVRRSCMSRGLRRSSGAHGISFKDTAWWGIFQNPDSPGLPESFCSLILLRRRSDEPFWATVNAWGSAGTAQRWRARWERWRGRERTGELVYFDPGVGVEGNIPVPSGLERDNLKKFWDELMSAMPSGTDL